MENRQTLKFFLGSNSGEGFYSLYEDYLTEHGDDFIWALKGGPGCGKSSFMKKIGASAEESGLDVEYIFCSGDPDSLDGIYIPAKKTGYVDGTAPHIAEVRYPGASGQYLDLGSFYDVSILKPVKAELASLTAKYKDYYKRAYEELKAAAALSPDAPGMVAQENILAAARRAEASCSREFKKRGSGGAPKKRFISALTCNGVVCLEDTVTELCSRICAVDNEYGLAPICLETVAAHARAREQFCYLCYDPLHPVQLQAVLLPELSLGYISAGGSYPWTGRLGRHIRLDAMLDQQNIKAQKQRLKSGVRMRAQLIESALVSLRDAKTIHDELERVYNPCVDFDGLYSLADRHLEKLFVPHNPCSLCS